MSTPVAARHIRLQQVNRLRVNKVVLDKRAIGAVLAAFLVSRLIVAIVIFFSSAAIPVQPGDNLFASKTNLLIDGLVRFDSWWYLDIARHGYQLGNTAAGVQSTVAFFPLYPLLIRALSTVTHDEVMSGIFISNVALLVALSYLYRLVRREFDDDTAGRAVFYLAAAPTAVFFSALYTESLYLALVIAGFFYARESQWVRAALVGALASATRNTGVILALVFVLEGMHQAGARFRPTDWQPFAVLTHLARQLRLGLHRWQPFAAALFVGTGLLAYMIYLSNSFGDPLAFINVQSSWGRSTTAGGILDIVANTRTDLNLGPHFWLGQFNPPTLWDIIATVAFLPLVIASAIKLRPAYGVYALATFLVPLATGNVGSMSRYSLMLLPVFIVLATWGRRPIVDRIILGTTLPLLAYFAIIFSHWYFAG